MQPVPDMATRTTYTGALGLSMATGFDCQTTRHGHSDTTETTHDLLRTYC